jgi:phenylacetate-CoA ligase
MKLRKHVSVKSDRGQGGEAVLVIIDQLTKRHFSLPQAAAPVLEILRQENTVEQIVSKLGEDYDEEIVERLVDQLDAKHLLDNDDDDATVRGQVSINQRSVRWEAMKRALQFGKNHVPIYRAKYENVDLDILEGEDDLHRVPMTRKQDIRDHYPDGFVPDVEDLRELTLSDAIVRGVSSGTSAGERLQTIHTRDVWRRQMIAGYLANAEVFPYIDLPNATFTSMHCADPDVCVTHLARMQDRIRAGTRLLLLPPDDPGAPTVDEVKVVLGELRAHNALWIDCNPTYMAALSYAIIDAGIEVPKIKVMTTGFEFLSAIHRRALKKVWGVNVYDRFSTSEMGNLCMLECEHGGFHVNDAYYYAEVVRDGRYAEPGELGQLVISTLHERLPMLRYQTRDLMFAADKGPCACGAVTMRVGSYAGRLKDILLAPDGSPRAQRTVDDAIAKAEGIRFYQIEQRSLAHYELKIVPEPSQDGARVGARAAEALREVFGPGCEFKVELARKIYPETSGKFRFTRTNVPDFELAVRAYPDDNVQSPPPGSLKAYSPNAGVPEGYVWPTTA